MATSVISTSAGTILAKRTKPGIQVSVLYVSKRANFIMKKYS
jgi:hypothetical protein